MASYLLSVGLNDYADRNIRTLSCCKNDAVEIYGLFSRTLGLGGNAVNLTGQVDQSQLWRALDDIGTKIRNGDTFILFFAGHGYQKPDDNDQLILLHDAAVDTLNTVSPRGAIALSALKAYTDKWTGVSRVLILDACRSWLPGRGEEAVFDNQAALDYLAGRDLGWGGAKAARGNRPDLLILNATRDGETAHELEKLGRGALAYALEKTLESDAGRGQALWLDGGFAEKVAARMQKLFREQGLGAMTQTPFLTPPGGRALLCKPPAAPQGADNPGGGAAEAAEASDDALIRQLRNGLDADQADAWRKLRGKMQTAGGRQRCGDMLAVLERAAAIQTPPPVETAEKPSGNRTGGVKERPPEVPPPSTFGRKAAVIGTAVLLAAGGWYWQASGNHSEAADYSAPAAADNHSGQDAAQTLSEDDIAALRKRAVNGDAEALTALTEAAEKGNVDGQSILGWMYVGGRGVPQNDAEAVKWFRKAAEQGDATGQNDLGAMYSRGGQGVPQDDAEATKWFRKAAEQGNAMGQYNLGLMYEKGGKGVPQDDAEAVKWYRKAAKQGHAAGQNNLGFMYQQGKGVPQDDVEAVRWYRKAAEQGDADGQDNLGFMYAHGKGIPQDDMEALKWFRRAAEQGHANGQINLGFMYKQGKGVQRDDAEAVKWYRKAAEQGDADAQALLGISYLYGEGIPQNNTKALTWFRKAAEQEHVMGQYNLGFMYVSGRGVPQDYKEAVKWYRKAAEQGHADGQFMLGVMYENGKGVKKDLAAAKLWYGKAAAQDDGTKAKEDAENALKRLNASGK